MPAEKTDAQRQAALRAARSLLIYFQSPKGAKAEPWRRHPWPRTLRKRLDPCWVRSGPDRMLRCNERNRKEHPQSGQDVAKR
jgi:hypothetical protein